MSPLEKKYIQAARSLATHLQAYARDRREDDKKAIPILHSELCRIKREEDEEHNVKD